jgi:Tfp pilus assembly pilus retraction ATPase PilT
VHLKVNVPVARDEHRSRIEAIQSKLNDDDLEDIEIAITRNLLQEHRAQLETFDSTIKSYTNAPLPSSNYIAEHRLGGIRREIKRIKLHLPIYARRQNLLDVIRSNRVLILKADTGSGKSTQLVQYLFDGGLAEEGM